MVRRTVNNLVASLSVAICLSLVVLVGSLTAQTKRTTKPKPHPTPTPQVLSGAEIISRAADDYRVPVQPLPTPVVESPADTTTATSTDPAWLKDLSERINKLEAPKKETFEDRQKRLLLNLDILTRAEQRSESLRKQTFEMIDKENSVKSRLDQIEFDSRPEMIERALQLSGSLRPEDTRDSLRKSLAAEKANLQSLLTEIQSTRAGLAMTLQKADQMVEKLRAKLEKDIDDSFLKDDNPDE